jgi:hypothetical protein
MFLFSVKGRLKAAQDVVIRHVTAADIVIIIRINRRVLKKNQQNAVYRFNVQEQHKQATAVKDEPSVKTVGVINMVVIRLWTSSFCSSKIELMKSSLPIFLRSYCFLF